MADGMSFVLHAPADEAYAASLAAGLDALPLRLEPGQVASLQFGAGVVCVVVWSDALARQSDALLGALSSSIVFVARVNGAAPPPAWAGFDAIDAREPGADARELAALVGVGRVIAFDRTAQLQGAAPGKQTFAARSAYGMAATLALASLATPFVMERAQATDAGVSSLQPPAAPAQSAGLLRASLAALSAAPAEAVEPAPSSTPALDHWLATPLGEEEADVLVAYTRNAALLQLAAFSNETMIDPKRQAFERSLVTAEVAPNDATEVDPPSPAKRSDS